MMQRPFNIYAVGKELYNIPDNKLREFLTDFPQAVKLSPEQVKTGIQPRVPSAGAVTGKPGKYAQGSEPDAENRLSQQDVQKIQEKRNRTALLRNEPLGLSGRGSYLRQNTRTALQPPIYLGRYLRAEIG